MAVLRRNNRSVYLILDDEPVCERSEEENKKKQYIQHRITIQTWKEYLLREVKRRSESVIIAHVVVTVRGR